MLDWVANFEWPPADSEQPHVEVGVAWMELVLSFMLYTQCYLPLHRPGKEGGHVFAWAQNATDALAYGYSWNECATQFASIHVWTAEVPMQHAYLAGTRTQSQDDRVQVLVCLVSHSDQFFPARCRLPRLSGRHFRVAFVLVPTIGGPVLS